MTRWILPLLMITGLPFALHAEPEAKAEDSRPLSNWSVEGGIGFSAGPGSFLMQLGAPYQVSRHFSLGPQFQIGVSESTTLVAPTIEARLGFDLSSLDSPMAKKIEPFASGGLGLVYIERETTGKTVDGTDFLLDLGFGVDYNVSEKVALQSAMRFNVIPGSAAGEKFYFSWQIVGIRYRF